MRYSRIDTGPLSFETELPYPPTLRNYHEPH